MIWQCPWPRCTEKTCKVCGEHLPLQAYAPSARTKDGCMGRCRKCNKRRVVAWNQRNSTHVRMTHAAWATRHPDKVVAAQQKYVATHPDRVRSSRTAYVQRNIELARERSRAWGSNNREKRRAHLLIRRAIRAGKLVRGTVCNRCAATNCLIDGHHEDYTKPYDVEWLCRSCHQKIAQGRRARQRRNEVDDLSREIA